MSSLADKAVLVHAPPGCPVGKACEAAFQAEGARVYATQRPDIAEHFDHLSDTGWAALMRQCLRQLKGLDIFVCCAPRAYGKAITDTSSEQFRNTLYDSGLAAWLGQKHAILAMRKQAQSGAIVHITSVLARSVAPHAAARCAAEAGILMSSKAAALECAKQQDNILVNTVLAGPIEEDGPQALLRDNPSVGAADVAAAAVFLVSDGASYMTGTELAVDQGLLAR
jgi:NAD(P)-dependent dehydrogenase (short-subunit alcohol dehydrogenase family)